MKHLYLLLIPILSPLAAQTSDGINVSVSRTVNLAQDEAAFTIIATGSLDSTEQQVKQALQDAGLPNPTVVATGLGQDTSVYPPGAAQILYQATVTIPAGSARDAAKSLENLRLHPPAPLKTLQYSVAFNAGQATRDAAWQSALPQLLADARKQAQSVAAAAGVNLGAIRSINDSTTGPVSGVFAFGSVAVLTGGISGVPYPGNVIPANLLGISPAQYTFSLNVRFAVAP